MAYVGRDAFFAGVRAYLDRHAWANTTLADLLVALERSSGRELRAWADGWLRTTGVSTLRPVWDGEALAVEQDSPTRGSPGSASAAGTWSTGCCAGAT